MLGVVLYAVLFAFVVRAHEETRIKNSLLVGFGLALALHALAVRLWTADEFALGDHRLQRRGAPRGAARRPR